MVAGIVFLAVLTLSGSALGYHHHGHDYDYFQYWGLEWPGDQQTGNQQEKRIWRFMLEDSWGGYEYLDYHGYLKGFHPDLVKAVCAKADKNCFWTVDNMENCWQSTKGVELPGQGLMAQWYDGCVGMFPTPERQNSFDFTRAWTPQYQGTLFYRREKSENHLSDLTGLKIGMMDGWATGPKCVSRQSTLTGNKPGEYQSIFYNSVNNMEADLLNNKIDAFLLSTGYDPKSDKIMRKGPTLQCTSDGAAVMTQYGSKVVSWWNDAMSDMVESGEYEQLCQKAQREHGHMGTIDCAF